MLCPLTVLRIAVSFQLECVGSVESGLTCMAWSPDQEIVVFSTGLYFGLYMYLGCITDFDTLF